MKNLKLKKNKNKGFTLVEMLVVCLIFSIIIGAVTAVFVSAIRAQRYNLAYYQLLDQTSYTLEYMARLIRMARKDDGTCILANSNYEIKTIPGTEAFCGGGCQGLIFKDYKGNCKGFFRRDVVEGGETVYQLAEYDGSRSEKILGLTSYYNLYLNVLNFSLSGQTGGDNLQPRVTISLDIQGRGFDPQPKLKIQTTISQRNLDI